MPSNTMTTAIQARCIRGDPSRERVPLEAELLPGQLEKEPGVIHEVAPPQPARLLDETEQPLEAGPLHPVRRLPDTTGVKVEGGPHTDQHGGVEQRTHARHPQLLFG